jgi:hypothetical protein
VKPGTEQQTGVVELPHGHPYRKSKFIVERRFEPLQTPVRVTGV